MNLPIVYADKRTLVFDHMSWISWLAIYAKTVDICSNGLQITPTGYSIDH